MATVAFLISPPPLRGRVREGGLAFLLIPAFALAACGFEPLYARRGGGGGATTDQLAAVYIDPIENRAGQQLYNALRDRMNPQGAPQRPAYRLHVRLEEERQEVATRQDEFASRANLTMVAVYLLSRAGDGATVYGGQSRVTASFNILRSEAMFSSLASENEARVRALNELAQVMTSRIGVALSPQTPAGAQP